MPAWVFIAGLALSALGTGYGVYASIQAQKSMQRNIDQQRQDARQAEQRQAAQMAQDKADMAANLEAQKKTQEETNIRLAAEQEEARQKSLASVPGMQQQLGSDLLAQEQAAYKRMAPQMEARLNALGLLQSGALPEAQAKYQGDLESQRQAQLAQFGINAQHQLNIQQPLANTSADVQRQSQAMQANLGLSQQNLSQQFANQNIANQNALAYQQYLGQLESAKNASAQQAANMYMNFGGQIGQGLIGYYGNQQGQGKQALDEWRRGLPDFRSNPWQQANLPATGPNTVGSYLV